MVKNANFSDATPWDGQIGKCGDVTAPASAHSCYPPAVNYSPSYYLINGVAFDRTNSAASALAVPAAAAQGNVVLRLVNAGLRMHVPSVVGSKMTLLAEDGNKLPGIPRLQSEVFLAAGKTYDVAIQPQRVTPATNPATYAPVTYPVFDRALSLSTANQRDGGMQVYINVAGGGVAGTVGSPQSGTALTATDKHYYCIAGSTLAITDPGLGLLAGSVGANGTVLDPNSVSLGTNDSLDVHSDGTFTYISPAGATSCGGSFHFLVNGTANHTATIAQCDANNHDPACALAQAPVVADVQFISNVSAHYASAPPGVMTGVSSNPGSFDLTAVTSSSAVKLNADGSFAVDASTATSCPALNPAAPAGATCVTFPYQVKNAQGTASNTATAAVIFLAPSNLSVNLVDAKNGVALTDYRWIIEEDRTFWIDPKCQINSTDPNQRPTSCPPLPVESLGYNFHTASMPVVAQGCVGTASCEAGQTVGGTAAVCDIGNGACRTDAVQQTPVMPGAVHLDPAKRYFISVLPGDAANSTIGGAGGPVQVDPTCDPTAPGANCAMRKFDIAKECGAFDPNKDAWAPGGANSLCGHEMGGAQIPPGTTAVNIAVQETPLPVAKISAFVFEDDNPLNGENDAGGGVDVLAPNEPGLGGFELKLFDQAGGLGDNTGQITYDEFNQPVSNSLAGKIDPLTGLDSCPITARKDGLVGMIPTCPTYESDGKTLSPLAGQVVVDNLYPGLYELQAYPAADRIARGEEWLQTNTLDGGKPHEAFIKANEPGYFQEFGPGGFHVAIGFANPKIINGQLAAYCSSAANGNQPCSHNLIVHVTNNHISRTPDERTFSSGTYDNYAFTQCYVSVGPPDAADFAFAKCDATGTATFSGLPNGVYKISVFDEWNDITLDGLVSTVTVNGDTEKTFPVTQWRTNLATRTFIDANGDGVSQDGEAGLALVNTNIRYRDGSYGFYNNTDLNGYAGFNEVFPFMNWLVVETSSTRFKPTGTHTVYDAGGAVDNNGGGSSNIAANLANTIENNSLPVDLRVPGARYCASADCPAGDTAGGSTGVVVPPQAWGNTQAWQGMLGQNSFMEFAMKPFAPTETGGIAGHVIYASTRPFDDPSLSLQLQWEPGVAHVKINLYSKSVDANGNEQLKLVDTTTTSSWDDWAQGFRTQADGTSLIQHTNKDGSIGYVSNMNCPGQGNDSPFFATLQDSKQWLDTADSTNHKKPLAEHAQFKCYDGWAQLNQIQPAPYDGMYRFPSVTAVDPATGRPTKSNCTACIANPDSSDPIRGGTPMLPPGTYVVEVVVPPGYELVKEEDKNILIGDVMIAPVTQQFAGFGNVFIMPDQASVNGAYNPNSPGSLNLTNGLGSVTFPRHEGDTGSIEEYWPCVGAERVVPDLNSIFPGAGQAAPFAGAKRRLCDRKEVQLDAQASVLAKFYVFSSTHIAGHFTGTITNDFASEFDPFSPQFGEKFGPPNLPVAFRDFNGNEVTRVYSDQWGIYDGLYFSTWTVNPPNPTGYAPQMAIACMNDPGPLANGQNDPAYNPAYSDFCYETPFMPGFTAYMDTPVIPVQSFADNYNLPDSQYPDSTPAILKVTGDGGLGPWVAGTSGNVLTGVTVTAGGSGYTAPPAVTFSNGGGSGGAGVAVLTPTSVAAVTLGSAGTGYTGVPSVIFNGSGTGATASLTMDVSAVTLTAGGRYGRNTTPSVTFSAPDCVIGPNCRQATGTANMSNGNNRSVTGVTITNRGLGYTSSPTVSFSSGNAAATSTLRVASIVLNTGGQGYAAIPSVTITGGGGNGATATAALAPTSVASVALTAVGSYTGIPTIAFNNSGTHGTGAAATALVGPTGVLTITALGDQTVVNPNFSGPNSTSYPFNQKNITRHYGFGSTAGTVALLDANGVAHNLVAPITWTDTTITGMVPSDLPTCSASNPTYTGANASALCGQLVITAANGKRSIDAVTVTVGGTLPWVVSPTGVAAPGGGTGRDYGSNFGRMGPSPIQMAIDSAAPGDLILVEPGAYRENLIMWKPVRLQGVGAAAVTVNADAQPAGKMDQWRRQVNCAFGLNADGTPNLNDTNYAGTDANNALYSCPPDMHQRVDRIPFEAIVGWDAAGNGNLAQVLQEPTLMGSYEGAGITVLGRGVRAPSCNDRTFGANCQDFWGINATGGAGAFTDGSVYLTANSNDCAASTTKVDGTDYGTANYLCNPSRVDGLSIINSSQGGGGVFVHGWAHRLEIANTRIYGNQGTLAGAINLGNGEVPDAFINDGEECGPALTGANAVTPCPPIPNGTDTNAAIPFQFNTYVRIHHNMILNNASIGDELFSGTPSGAGGITVSAGADHYQIDHNWIAGNLSTGDGGGVQHLGLSFNGNISHNYILFNQSTNPTLPTNGGGLDRGKCQPRPPLNGNECGSTNDQDCPPGLGEGTGPGLVIDANLLLGNSAESGSGGGLRLQQINGSAS